MRRIPRRPLGTRIWKRWITDCRKATDELEQQVAAGASTRKTIPAGTWASIRRPV